MNFRRLNIVAAFPAVLAGVAGCGQAEQKRPNIIFIMTDDHTTQAISCYGSRLVQTPNMDRLAQEGMRFDNPYRELRNMKEEDERLYNWLLYSLNSIRRSKRDRIDIDLSNYFTSFVESWRPILSRKSIQIEDPHMENMDGVFPTD